MNRSINRPFALLLAIAVLVALPSVMSGALPSAVVFAQDDLTDDLAEAAITEWEFTVDYGDETYRETGNAWRTWPFGPAVGGSYRYLSHYDEGRPRLGSAYWGAQMPVTGRYEVMLSFRATENRSRDVNFHVLVAENEPPEASYTVDQRAVPSQNTLTWISLGEYVWQKGQQVVVHLDGTDDNESDEADAVKWRLLENLEQPPQTQGDVNLIPVMSLLLF